MGATLVVLLAIGCGEEAPEGPVPSRETFVETVIDLRLATPDSTGELADTARARILERHGITEEELLRFARVRGGSPGEMQEVWEEVDRRLDSVRTAGADTLPP